MNDTNQRNMTSMRLEEVNDDETENLPDSEVTPRIVPLLATAEDGYSVTGNERFDNGLGSNENSFVSREENREFSQSRRDQLEAYMRINRAVSPDGQRFSPNQNTQEDNNSNPDIGRISSANSNDPLNETQDPRRLKNFLNQHCDTDSDSDDGVGTASRGDIQEHLSVQDIASKCKAFAGLDIIDCFKGAKVKVGQRVVRGNDWVYEDADGGEGNIGTVVEVIRELNTVRVLWDSQDLEGTLEYRIGKDRKFDLKLFDNAQTGVIHPTCHCNFCDEKSIRGMKWRCRLCKELDLCSDCYMNNKHNTTHVFERKTDRHSVSVQINPRNDSTQKKALGIVPHAKVELRKNDQMKGVVQKYVENTSKLYNCDALVKSEDMRWPRRFRLGRKGKCDLKYLETGGSKKYYKEHLPGPLELTDGLVAGLRVVSDSTNAVEELGTITSVQNHPGSNSDANPVQVQWDNGKKEERSINGLKLFDTSQIGVKHKKLCCGCDEATYIKGILWECTHCTEKTLCTFCYMDDRGCCDHEYKRIIETGGWFNKRDSKEII